MFKKLLPLKSDPILGLVQKFNKDPKKYKLNLTVGELYYYENNNKNLLDYQFIMNKIDSYNTSLIHKTSKYLPITGCDQFIKNSEKFIFGNNNNRNGIQTLSGTGSLTIGNYITQLLDKNIYIPSSSWPNHFNIFNNYNKFSNINDLLNIPDNSIILFHTCCNNPTGIDYSKKQWNKIINILKQKKHIAYFDSAYIGLVTGDNNLDSLPIRELENYNIPYIVSTSYAKNFGLYGQRIGSLFYNFNDKEFNTILNQYITKFIRSTYSNPPRAGAEMASYLMENEIYMCKWRHLLKEVINQQTKIRLKLDKNLGWNTMNKNGLFFMSPISKQNIIKLREKNGIYMLENGRINISGLDESNIDYFIENINNLSS